MSIEGSSLNETGTIMLCSKLYIAEKNANPQMQPALFIAGDTLYTESAPENVFVGPGAIDEKLKEQYKLKAMLENGKITEKKFHSDVAKLLKEGSTECKVVPFRGSNYNAVFGFIGAKTYKSSFEVFLKDLANQQVEQNFLVENLRRIMIEREIAMCNAFLGTPESAIIKKYIEQNGIGKVIVGFVSGAERKLYSIRPKYSIILEENTDHTAFYRAINIHEPEIVEINKAEVFSVGAEQASSVLKVHFPSGEDYAGMIQLRSVLLEAFKAAYVWQANTIVRAGGSRLINDKLEGFLVTACGIAPIKLDLEQPWYIVFLEKLGCIMLGALFANYYFRRQEKKKLRYLKAKSICDSFEPQ